MTVWVGLIRGVNVGGKNLVPMKPLAAALEAQGCAYVRTYLQSGNVVLSHAAQSEAAVEGLVASAIQRLNGFRPDVIAVSGPAITAVVRGNPFKHAESDPKKLHAIFLGATPSAAALAQLAALRGTDEVEVIGRVLYLHTPDGLLASKIAARPEQHLKVRSTTRNWRTVTALADMANA
jgi:uncharacterized protein (DUF1697 family)